MTMVRIHGSIVATLVMVLLAGSCRETPSPKWSPDTATLVFMSNRDGNAEIYRADGHDGEWINLTRSEFSENWPQWSPDGERIAYQSNRDGNLDIWVMDADGSNPRRLTDNPAHDYLPAWSPDGTMLTFASWRREPGDTADAVHIYRMNGDGSGQQRIFPQSPGTSTGAQWMPDGNGFLLTVKYGTERGDLYLVDSTGREIRRLTNEPAYNGAAVFSPDGGQIACYADHGDASDIVVMDRDGGNRRTVVSGGRNWYPRWSPDGRWLIYTAAAPGEDARNLDVYGVPVDGATAPVRLATGPGREAEGQWRPEGRW